MRRKFKFSALTDFSHLAMDWIGSIPSLIVHTLFFLASFSLVFFGVAVDKILLVVTTLVSLEAIYLAIFIQMAVNQNTKSLSEVEEDIDEIQEDVVEIQEDVDEIQKDIDEIQEDVDEIQEDVDEIQEDDAQDENHELQNKEVLAKIATELHILMAEIQKIKNESK